MIYHLRRIKQMPQNENLIKILIVDDIENVAESLKATVEERFSEIKTDENLQVQIDIETDFEKATETLLSPHGYDIAILDVFRGSIEENDRAGIVLWKQILSEKFMSVVIFTASEDDFGNDFPGDNPVFKLFRKGVGNDEGIANHICSLDSYVLAIRQIKKEFNEVIRDVLLETTPHLWKAETDITQRPQRLLRSARRRLAAKMDYKTAVSDEKMVLWEQYIYPPLENSLLSGDIIRVREEDPNNPESYRIVLTPSCDLVQGKVESILVAKCANSLKYVQTIDGNFAKQGEPTNNQRKSVLGKLPSALTQPQNAGYVFLPKFESVIPTMTAYLRDLELIPCGDIGNSENSENKFVRVVSVDSPFREQLSWAYLQIAGRLGMPEWDIEQSIRENFEILQTN